ncbi:Hamartin protein-domain-containing protein [Phaeosphaeria sp. MPI-PUGE-AT-0046c]|nr:Hamartin protein-domain-containing protein [Phaeosphaeria sp. MPI-PUGE-AT-0046c]
MREAVRALNTTFSAPTLTCPLPDELQTTIENFLERYDNIDDHDSQRFHEDLHTLYQRHVAPSPDKNGPFLEVLRMVRPALTGEVRLTVWWNLALKPTINGVGHKRQEIEDAREIMLTILVYNAETDKDGEQARLSKLFTKRILDAYLARTNVPLSAEDTISPENELLAQQLESVLVTFGRKMPKVRNTHVRGPLNLLSAFVRLQPPHLHLVLETPLIQHLEKCLLIDASSTVIELALVVLIMFLPHICASLTSDHHLSKMFLIYSRVLCWDRLGGAEEPSADEDANDEDEDSDEETDRQEAEPEPAWEPVQQSLEYPDSSPPTLMHYFTFLYGLFPLNFMSFVRKPRKYLKSLNFPGARDFDLDQDLLQSRTEPYRRVHLLHPNMFSTTVEDELHENRWLKSDPADVVTECMDLCVATSSTLEDPGPPPSAALPALPVPPVPEVPAQFSLDDEGTTPSLDNFVQSVTSSNSPSNIDFRGQTMASLQREIMLLRNDLNFERYLKLQHLAHIGQLQRKHIKEATADAETQNLINTNKTLKARLAKANELYAQLKKETLTSRNQSKKWETDLSARVRTYRESEKTWHSEEDSLRYELQRTQSDYDHLKQIVEKAEAEQVKAQQRTRALEYELEDYSNLQRDLEAAQEKIMTLEDQRKELHALMQERNDLRNDLEMSNMRLSSRELERERSIKAYERRILELETRLQMAEKNTGRPGQLPSSVQQMLDSALAASHAKLQQLKKTHYHLLEQHTELQMKYHDLESDHRAEQGRYHSQEKSGHLDYEKTRLDRNSSMRQPNNYNSRYLPPLATEISPNEEREQYVDYQSPNSVVSPGSATRTARPDPGQKPQRSQATPSPYPNFGGSFAPDFSSAYDASLNPQFQSQSQSQPQNSTTQSSGKSSYSVDTEGSTGREKKDKIEPKSEVRYYGRGGAQNISKKKDKDAKKPGSSKTGGFRGLKGIM